MFAKWCGYGWGNISATVISSFDKIEKQLEHLLSNVKSYYNRYISLKSDSNDIEIIKLKMQLNKFAEADILPMSWGKKDQEFSQISRSRITVGSSNEQ
jgi:hypothetical protein